MNIKIVLLLLLFLPGQDDWVLRKDADNIEVYTRRVSSSDFKELKSKTTVKASLSAIVTLLTDAEHYTQWAYNCIASNMVKKISDSDVISYQLFEAPWPFDNRDVVAEAKVSQDPSTKVVTITSMLADTLVPEKKDVVRIKKFRTEYTLVPKANGLVEINYELGTEPGGNVPAWLANLLMVKGPFNTQYRINTLLESPRFKNVALAFIKEPGK